MNTLYVTQQVRSLRICFLIGYEKKDLLEAIAINTILWGGYYNPIIQLGKSSSPYLIARAKGIISAFDADFVVNLSATLPEEFSRTLNRKIIPRTDVIEGVYGGRIRPRIGIDTYKAFVADVPQTGLTKEQKERYSLITTGTKGLEPFIATIYGKVDEASFPKVHEFLTKDVGLTKISVGKKKLLSFKYLEPFGPIHITRFGLKEMGGNVAGFARNLVFVGDIHKIPDLIEFWNLRAAGENVLFLPRKNYQMYENVVKDFMSDHLTKSKFQKEHEVDLQSAPSTLKTDGKEFMEIGDWITKVTGKSLPRRMWVANWGRRSKRVAEDISCIIPFNKREKMNVTYTTEGIEPFNLTPPDFFINDFFSENRHVWAVDLSFIGFYDKNFTIDLPNQEGMQQIAQYNLALGGLDTVRIGERGLVAYADNNYETMHLRPVSVAKVLATLFEKAGYKITPSTPGIFSRKILQIMGDLEDCRVFKIKGVREAFKKLNTDEGYVTVYDKRTKKGKRVYGEVAKARPLTSDVIRNIIKSETEDAYQSKNWISDLYADIVLYFGQEMPLTPEIVLEYLISRKLILPGLKLQCNECTQKDWYQIGTFSDTFKCKYCYAIQDVPRIDKQPWFYKTEGMVSIADEGKGSIPVILGLWRLNHSSHFGNGKFITSHNVSGISNDFKGEVDFVYYTLGHYSQRIELVLGEARNYAEYKPKDIKKSLTIAGKFINKPFLAFVTLKDSFSDREKELLKYVMKKGYYVLPITRFETDPYDLFKRFDKLPDKYSSDLQSLSINLCQVNLGMTSQEVYELVEADQRKRMEKFIQKLDARRQKLLKKQEIKPNPSSLNQTQSK